MENLIAIFGPALLFLIIMFLIVLAILTILLPFIILSIRNQIMKLNGQIAGIDKKIVIANNNLVGALTGKSKKPKEENHE